MFGLRFGYIREAVDYLKRKIVERKNEKPRRKFVEDHQLIHDRKKNEPCIPILLGHDQEAWFAKLDSNGVWERVFEFISKPTDMTSAYYSCEMFRKHLEMRRKLALLPKVLEVFRDTGRMQYSGFGDNITDGKQEESSEILKQRLVSKSWKKIVEEVFLVPLKHSPSLPIWHSENWNWNSPMVCLINKIQDVEFAAEKLQNAGTSAALVRLMEMDDSLIDDKETKIEQFLAIHGGSVWGLQIYYYYLDYRKLCRVVSSVPHLKALELEPYWNPTTDDVGGANEQLQQMIFQNPFPYIPSLEYCYLNCYLGLPGVVEAEILSKNSNLKAVRLGHNWTGNVWTNWRVLPLIPDFVWNALQSLRVEYFYLEYTSWHREVFMKDFLQLERVDWPLKFLNFDLGPHHESADYLGWRINICSAKILEVLSRFADSLLEVSFKVHETVNLSLVHYWKNKCCLRRFA